jgi:hypothetical protein
MVLSPDKKAPAKKTEKEEAPAPKAVSEVPADSEKNDNE